MALRSLGMAVPPEGSWARLSPGTLVMAVETVSEHLPLVSPAATVGQEYQVWAAAIECHSHEEGGQCRR